MTYTEEEVQAFLEHHGVKGMHWGVRKERTPEEQQLHESRVKSAAIAGGAGAGAFILTGGNPALSALAAGGAYFASRHALYPVSSASPHQKETGKAFIEAAVKHQPKA